MNAAILLLCFFLTPIMWPPPSTVMYINISVLSTLAMSMTFCFDTGCLVASSRSQTQLPPLQQQAKVRSIVQAIGIPVEAYLACKDDYYRKVITSRRTYDVLLME